MHSFQSTDPQVAAASAAPSQPTQITVLQLCGCLNQPTHSTVQAVAVQAMAVQTMLEQALHQEVKVLVIDLIGVTSLAPETVAVFQAGMKLAASLGKELVIWPADASTYAALSDQWDHQSAREMGDRTETVHPGFDHFLKNRHHPAKTSLSAQSLPQPASRPISTAPILAADAYTSAQWHASALISQIA